MKIYSLLFFVFLQSCSYTIIDETTNSAVEVDGRDDLIGYIYKTKRTLYNKKTVIYLYRVTDDPNCFVLDELSRKRLLESENPWSGEKFTPSEVNTFDYNLKKVYSLDLTDREIFSIKSLIKEDSEPEFISDKMYSQLPRVYVK